MSADGNYIDHNLLEPVVAEHCPDATPTFQTQYSAAISLKRIADKLDGLDLQTLGDIVQALNQNIHDVQTYGLKVAK